MTEERPDAVGMRVCVVGTCGSGKTAMACSLATRLGLVHVELDALAWGPNWVQRPADELRSSVARAAAGERWVIDGNYGKLRDVLWARADTIVWLDYPFPRVFLRLLRRTLRRVFTREELWHGNREHLRMTFLSRDSILLWAIKTHGRRKREYGELLTRACDPHLRVVHLQSPREARRWLGRVRPAGT